MVRACSREAPMRGGKFISAVSVARIDIVPDRVLDDLSNLFQYPVSFNVAMGVVVSFEVVDV
jgi:hypothetical protein